MCTTFRDGSLGKFLKEILDEDRGDTYTGRSDTFFGDSDVSDIDGRTVDLILGPTITDREFQVCILDSFPSIKFLEVSICIFTLYGSDALLHPAHFDSCLPGDVSFL